MIMRRAYGCHVPQIGVCRVEKLIDRLPLRGEPVQHALEMCCLRSLDRIGFTAADVGNRAT